MAATVVCMAVYCYLRNRIRQAGNKLFERMALLLIQLILTRPEEQMGLAGSRWLLRKTVVGKTK